MRTLVLFTVLLLLVGISATAGQVPAVDPELVRLRHEWAMKFFEPGPHMELAKYFRKKGNLIQAFYILESARRTRFDQKTFDRAFLLHFGGFAPLDNSPKEEEKYVELLKASPNDVKLLSHLADIYISRADYKRAEPLLRSAYEKDSQNYDMLLGLDELYRRLETPEKGAKLIEEYLRKYPNSAGDYYLRLSRIEKNREDARKLLSEALKKYPEEGYFWLYSGQLAMQSKNLDEAETNFVKAAELDKSSKSFQAAAASFFRVERKDLNRALGYYLNVYFLDPHAHFDGFAEAKVSSLNYENSKSKVEKAVSEGKKLESLFNDTNPMIVAIALSKLAENWDSSKTQIVLSLMRHDDVQIRWSAMLILIEKEGRKLDATIKTLLLDSDFRVRGLAAYMAVKLWKDESFPVMKSFLQESADVLRFDAVSALLMFGGATGKQIVKDHRSEESSEYLRKLIDASLANRYSDQ
jgi:tetratricopeptide (TPR) repeat protein